MRHVEKILTVFAGCCTATDNSLYFPIESVGRVVHSALAMDREIGDLNSRIELMQRQINQLTSPEELT